MENTNHLSENELALYVDGLRMSRLEAVPGKLRDHVQHCLECKRAIMEIAAAVPQSAYGPGEVHPYFDARFKGTGWLQGTGSLLRLAAGIALLLGIGIFILYIATQRVAEESEATEAVLSQPQDAAPPAGAVEVRDKEPLAIASAFKPSSLYDRLTTEEYRSGSAVSHQPASGDTISAGQLFVWNGGAGTHPFGFTILDNRGREVIQTSVSGESYRLTRNLPAGLYYWKLERAGELVFVGKFYVVN